MDITVLDSGFVTGDFLKPLGYAGEMNSRKINIIHPNFKDCYYQLIVKRFDEVYKIGIDEGETMVPPSLLRSATDLNCQFVALSKPDSITNSETDTFLFESKPFTLKVAEGLNLNGVSPIPTYEELQNMYKNMNDAKLEVENAKASNQRILDAIQSALNEARTKPVEELTEETLQNYRQQLVDITSDYVANGLLDDIIEEVSNRIDKCDCSEVGKMSIEELKQLIKSILSDMQNEANQGSATWLYTAHHFMSSNGNIVGGR